MFFFGKFALKIINILLLVNYLIVIGLSTIIDKGGMPNEGRFFSGLLMWSSFCLELNPPAPIPNPFPGLTLWKQTPPHVQNFPLQNFPQVQNFPLSF